LPGYQPNSKLSLFFIIPGAQNEDIAADYEFNRTVKYLTIKLLLKMIKLLAGNWEVSMKECRITVRTGCFQR
jgi:hypothetical protein